jgi:hypothetical protein
MMSQYSFAIDAWPLVAIVVTVGLTIVGAIVAQRWPCRSK